MDNEYLARERRKFKRVKASFIVTYEIDKPLKLRMLIEEREANAVMLDLSEGGMSIVTEYKIPALTILLIKFTLINLSANDNNRIRTMEMTGEVSYNILAEEREYRMGICFTHIDEEDKCMIANFVKMAEI